MYDEELKKLIEKWVQKIGAPEAVRRMVLAGVGVSIAQKLAGARYLAKPSFAIGQMVLKELAKDGFRLSDDEVA